MKTVASVYEEYNIDDTEDLFDLSIMALDNFIEGLRRAEHNSGFEAGYKSGRKSMKK